MLSNNANKKELEKESSPSSNEKQNLSQNVCRTFSEIFSIQRNSKKNSSNVAEEQSSTLSFGVSSPSTSSSLNHVKNDSEQFFESESLKMPHEDLKPIPELGEFIIANHKKIQDNDAPSGDEMNRILTAIKLAAKVVNREINKAGLADILGAVGCENIQGEAQQKLDLFANNKFLQALANREVVCGVCSEENENFICVNKNARYVVVIDPLDGSSNLDVNVSVGTIFSIYRRLSPVGSDPKISDFLQPGTKQIAAGYVLYGSSTILVITIGEGVHGFTLDPSLGTFYLSHPYLTFPEKNAIYSVNVGNFNAFPEGVKRYLDYCQSDEEGCPYSLRYIGSLVSDFHRNLLLGGIFLYPPTKKNKRGKLRLLYEANPMAFLAEQAGGMAIDGKQRILDIIPQELHQRCPFFVGVTSMVKKLEEFLQLYDSDESKSTCKK